jgi:DNA-binding MarR family transcriptional regulator
VLRRKQFMENTEPFSGYVYRMEQELSTFFPIYKEYMMPREKDGITHVQTILLKKLVHEGPSTISDIAEAMGVTMAAVSSLTDRLVKGGLITRQRSELDRRVVLINLTPAGREEIEKYMEASRKKMIKVFEEMGEEKVTKLIEVISYIKSGMEKCLKDRGK